MSNSQGILMYNPHHRLEEIEQMFWYNMPILSSDRAILRKQGPSERLTIEPWVHRYQSNQHQILGYCP